MNKEEMYDVAKAAVSSMYSVDNTLTERDLILLVTGALLVLATPDDADIGAEVLTEMVTEYIPSIIGSKTTEENNTKAACLTPADMFSMI